MTTSDTGADSNVSIVGAGYARFAFGPQQIGGLNYALLLVAVLAQLLTVCITWEVWQVRSLPPNLPLIEAQQISFGIWVLVSLACVLVAPKQGFWVHVSVVLVASLYDQFRMQPQFLAIIFLMLATIWDWGKVTCRWFLVSVWLWAGVHKILSPHWFAHASFWILAKLDIPVDNAMSIHWFFALSVGLAEVIVGLAAVFKPKLAAIFCVAMHCSIFVLLCVIDWNYSVLPWNIATAIVGCWTLWTIARRGKNEVREETARPRRFAMNFTLAVVFLVPPAGFYYGLLDHGYASVLYSDFIARGLMTKSDRVEKIRGWEPVHVPFPSERRTFPQYFELVAEDGDKLHLFDPRPALDDQYFCLRDGKAIQIDAAEFFDSVGEEVAGVAMNDPKAKFWLKQWGKLLGRWYKGVRQESMDNSIAYAYTMKPEYYCLDALQMLSGLPNLQQLQLANCPVDDGDLKYLSNLKQLTFVGLNNTNVTDEGLRHLESLPHLRLLEIEDTKISPDGMNRLQLRLAR